MALAPGDATLKADLAAAHLQRATDAADPSALVPALTAASRALDQQPSLLEAKFNRAVILEKLALTSRAITEWRRYLDEERDPEWSREAGEHLRRLVATTPQDSCADARSKLQGLRTTPFILGIVNRCPRQAREFLEEELLVRWSRLQISGPHEARNALLVAAFIADRLTAITADQLPRETLAQLTRASGTDHRRLGRLAVAFREYGQGLDKAREGSFVPALAHLQVARQTMATEHLSFLGWIVYQIAICHYQRAEYDQAKQLLTSSALEAEHSGYLALHGQTQWLIGLIDIIRGRPSASLTALESAATDFRRLNDRLHYSKLGAVFASNYDYLGRQEEAWRRLLPAVIDSSTLEEPMTRSSICQMAAWLAVEDAEPEAALYFQDEVLRQAQAIGSDYAEVEALRLRAVVLAAAGRRLQATFNLELARRQAVSLSDPRMRGVITADISLVEAELSGPSSLRRTMPLVSKAIQMFQSTSYHYGLVRAFYQRARAEAFLGEDRTVERDLARALAEVEKQRKAITAPEERIAYFDRVREIVEAMIAFQIDKRGKPAVALRYSENARARVLLDWLVAQPGDFSRRSSSESPGQFDLSVLQTQIPHDTAVIEYALLPRRLLIWVIRRESVDYEQSEISRHTVEEMVSNLVRAIKNHDTASVGRLSELLYDLLIRPVAHDLRSTDRIVAIPDGALHSLPFALLRDEVKQRYLVEDHVCTVAPSAQILVASLRRDRRLARLGRVNGLMIADPDFDKQLYPNLARLVAQASDHSFVEAISSSRVLSDGDATRAAFLALAGEYVVVHFGGHAIVNPRRPLLSHLLFAGHGDQLRGLLYSGELLNHSFRRTRLAVLASCSTAIGKLSKTEGVESLARPFLIAGVPAVVGSLWDVEDSTTAQFFSQFYRHLGNEFDVAGALRAAQLHWLSQGSREKADPFAWGAYELIGANCRRLRAIPRTVSNGSDAGGCFSCFP